jgi:hypothetical protein
VVAKVMRRKDDVLVVENADNSIHVITVTEGAIGEWMCSKTSNSAVRVT